MLDIVVRSNRTGTHRRHLETHLAASSLRPLHLFDSDEQTVQFVVGLEVNAKRVRLKCDALGAVAFKRASHIELDTLL